MTKQDFMRVNNYLKIKKNIFLNDKMAHMRLTIAIFSLLMRQLL